MTSGRTCCPDLRHSGRVPSGRVHNLINIAVYAGLAAAAVLGTRSGAIVVTQSEMLNFTVGFMAGTFLLSPDLDLATGNVDSKRHWGLLGGLWIPYGMLFSHRGLSHTWILGPLTRLAYMAIVVVIVVGLIRTFAPQVQLPQLPEQFGHKFLLPLMVGYYVSQWLHLVADGVRPDHGLRHGARKAGRAYRKVHKSARRHF